MGCCGNQRAALRNGSVTRAAGSAAGWTPGALEFEYVGQGELRVTGPMTGSVYTFAGNGSRSAVNAADVPSLAAMANLRPLR